MSEPAATAPFADCVTFLPSADLEATSAFYETALGLPLALDQGGCRIYRTSPNGYLGFCMRDEAGPSIVAGRAEPILTLVTPDVDAWHARLTAHGLRFETPPVYNPRFDIYHCFLRDPSGYLVEIQAFCDPGWPGGGHLPRPG